MDRSSGIILHLSSLPGGYGIGSLGASARAFVDFLAAAGTRYWQMLPLGPTVFKDGDSPYLCSSAFAGNPYFIDLDELAARGLLEQGELPAQMNGDKVDYAALSQTRPALLRAAFSRFEQSDEYLDFCADNADWLGDYTLFMALKTQLGNRPFLRWPRDIKYHYPDSVARWKELLRAEIEFHGFLQYEFFRQYESLKAYAAQNGVKLIGDVPIYVPLDSADVWAHPELFLLDKWLRPTRVAGVPPDYFSKEGQLWGSPVYNWPMHRQDGYAWWLRRMQTTAQLFDVIRLDHFRGFASYWSVARARRSARYGRWDAGPGLEFIESVQRHIPTTELVAEDLGHLTPDVYELLSASGLRGMRVLQFCFGDKAGRAEAAAGFYDHLALYAGTHDNTTVLDYLKTASKAELESAKRVLGLEGNTDVWGFLAGGMHSRAELFVAQMQDYLELGANARMNTPATTRGNWLWRLTDGQLSAGLAKRIKMMTEQSGRE